MAEAGKPATAQGRPAGKGTPWSLIAFAVLAAYALLIVLFNTEEVKVSFVFFSARISKIVLILLCLGLGFAAGFLLDRFRKRRSGAPG
ncbi:MAG: LapA family protein [Thermoleophilia bacterium]|nr:LapA family protein [Gaiellaceae bacterium]MDW8339732.1 LapA family protein [Thermoleophilia bacterium]